jgi:hypothetical protein
METTTFADERTAVMDTPPAWSEPIVRRLADVIGTSDDGEANATDGTSATETRTGEREARGDRPRSEPMTLDHGWLLVAPLVGAVVLSAVSSLADPNPLQTGTSAGGLLAFAVLIPFFLLCVGGTLALVRDAERLRAAGTDWSPNPWYYVAPSAVALGVLHAYRLGGSGAADEAAVGLFVGSLVVALAASSILAGPAYLLQRRRRFGSD